MPRAHASDEVQVLRFFEDSSLETAQAVFNIVKEKMRARGAVNSTTEGRIPRKREKHSGPSDIAPPPPRSESP